MSIWQRYFRREPPDVLGILGRQAAVTVAGMRDFAEWSRAGSEERARAVRDAEHEADDVRLELLRTLSDALTTPVDQEDVYTLSERLDAVLNAAKNTVRESEVLGVPTDEHTAEMGALALETTEHLVSAIEAIKQREEHPGGHADAAIKSSRRIDRAYRHAIASLPADCDAKTAIAMREIYRGYTEIAEAAVAVATRTWYALLKGA